MIVTGFFFLNFFPHATVEGAYVDFTTIVGMGPLCICTVSFHADRERKLFIITTFVVELL